jgi:hypothetical protein
MAKVICTLPPSYENVFDVWDNTPTWKKILNNLHAKLFLKKGIEDSTGGFKWQHWHNLFWKAC